MAGDGLSPRAVVAQQGGDAGGEGDNTGVLAGSGGVVQAGQQAGAFGPGPGQRLLGAGQAGNRGRYRADHRGGGSAGLAGKEVVGEGRGVLVVIQQPDGGPVLVIFRVKPIGEGTGMLADEVVQPVPARGRLDEQVPVIQGLQAAAGNGQAGAVQGGGGEAVDVRARMQPEPAEQPLLVRGEVRIRQVERSGDRQVLGGHQLQPVHGRRQLGGPPGDGPGGVVVQLAGQHPDRQRQVPAQPGNLPDRRVCRARPARPASRTSKLAASPGGRVSRLIAVAFSSAVRWRRLVTSTRLSPVPGSRLRIRISSRSRKINARNPSHFGSKIHVWPAGNSSIRLASIGSIGGFAGRFTLLTLLPYLLELPYRVFAAMSCRICSRHARLRCPAFAGAAGAIR